MLPSGRTYRALREDLILLADLGSGAFGSVHLYRHVEDADVKVAVKKVQTVQRRNEPVNQTLQRDIEFMQQCHSPFIVSYYGYTMVETSVWIFMEPMLASIEVVSKQAIQSRVSLPEAALGLIAVSVIKGLHYLLQHLAGMHRDIKPSNILVGHDGSN